MASGAPDSIFSPSLLRVVQSAAQAAEVVQCAAQQVSSAAQQRVQSEISQFQEEAAKTDQWRAEQVRLKSLQPDGTISEPSAEPEKRKLVFSIEDDFDAVTKLEPSSSDVAATAASIVARTTVAAAAPAHAAASTQASASTQPSAAAEPTAPAAPSAVPRWQPRLHALLTILEHEAEAAKAWREADEQKAVEPAPRMPAAELLLQLRELQTEVVESGAPAATSTAAATSTSADADAAAASSSVRALQEQVEQLAAELAKAELLGRSRAEAHRRQLEALDGRYRASEAESADLMRVVEEHITEEAAAKAAAADAAAEVSTVRKDAGARLKALVEQNRKLQEEVAGLNEIAELNVSCCPRACAVGPFSPFTCRGSMACHAWIRCLHLHTRLLFSLRAAVADTCGVCLGARCTGE